MSTARERTHERKQIMGEVMTNHPAINTWDQDNVFSAEDVAVIPHDCNEKIRKSAIERADRMLKTFGCLVPRRRTDGSMGYLHARSPVINAEGLRICDETQCIFHVGGRKGIIPIPCPDEMTAVREKNKLIPVIVINRPEEPKQLQLL